MFLDNLLKGICFGGIFLAFGIGWLFYYQTRNMLRNVTTIEDKNDGFHLRVV